MTTTLDGNAALVWANAQTAWQAGMCLNFVWNAYGAPVAIPAGGYPNALAGWSHTADKHPGADAPNGFPVYFSGPDGHVAIMKDRTRGLLRSTYTSGGRGLVGDITVDTIVKSWGRTILGWGGDAFGYPISTTGFAGGGGVPLPEETEAEIMAGARLYHQISTNGDQSYIAHGNYTLQIISYDYAVAIASSQGMSVGEIPVINEYDFNAIADLHAQDIGSFEAHVKAASAG